MHQNDCLVGKVVIPMRRSLAIIRPIKGASPLIDFSAIISQYRPEPLWSKCLRRIARLVTYFW